jgi:hypothetical protein
MSYKKITIEDLQKVVKILERPIEPKRSLVLTESEMIRCMREGASVDWIERTINGFPFHLYHSFSDMICFELRHEQYPFSIILLPDQA